MLSLRLNLFFAKLWLKDAVKDIKLIVALIVLAIPVTALYSFKDIEAHFTSATFSLLNEHTSIRQIAIKNRDVYEAVAPNIWPEVESRFSVDIFAERQKKLNVEIFDQSQSISATFLNESVELLDLPIYLGSLKEFGSQKLENGYVVALSYEFWRDTLNQKVLVGHTINVNGNPLKVVAIMAPSFKTFRKSQVQQLFLPYRQFEPLTGLNALDPSPSLFTYLIFDNRNYENLNVNLNQTLQDDAYIIPPSTLILSPAMGVNVNDYLSIINRLELLKVLFTILLIFSILSYTAAQINRATNNNDLIQVVNMCGATPSQRTSIGRIEPIGVVIISLPVVLFILCMNKTFINSVIFSETTHFASEKDFAIFQLILYWSICLFIISEAITFLQSKISSAQTGRGASVTKGVKLQANILMALMMCLSASALLFAAITFSNLLMTETKNLGYEPSDIKIVTRPIPQLSDFTFHQNNKVTLLISELEKHFEAAAVSMSPPFSDVSSFGVWLDTKYKNIGATSTSKISNKSVSKNYFEVMNSKIIKGRGFSEQSSFEIIVNQTLWEAHFKDEPLYSATLIMPTNGPEQFQSYKIVGVVEDIYNMGPDIKPIMTVYSPIISLTGFESIVIRSTLPAQQIEQGVLAALAHIGENENVLTVNSLTSLVNNSKAPSRSLFLLSSIIMFIVLASTLIVAFTLIKQLTLFSAREIAVKSTIGYTTTKLFLIELFGICVTTLFFSFATVFFIGSKKQDIFKVLNNETYFDERMIFIAVVLLLLTVSSYLYYCIHRTVKVAWQYLT